MGHTREVRHWRRDRWIKQGPQRRQPHHVESSQRHLVARQCRQCFWHVRQYPLPERLDRVRNRIVRVGRVKYAVDREPLVGEAKRFQFLRGACRFRYRALLDPHHQDNRGQRRIAQCREGSAKPLFLHLQSGMRSQTRGPAVVVLQKTGPRLRQTE